MDVFKGLHIVDNVSEQNKCDTVLLLERSGVVQHLWERLYKFEVFLRHFGTVFLLVLKDYNFVRR